MKTNRSGFSLIEILVGSLIFSMIIIAGFDTLSKVSIAKVKLTQQAGIIKEGFYFSEKLFEEIKKGGTTDFEEYFNRKVYSGSTSTGHYISSTGWGNFGSGGMVGSTTYGSGFYFCASGSGTFMGTGGCFTSYINKPQRYGEYVFQFIDYNSNQNNDSPNPLGDSNGDGKIRGDDDDEDLGEGPTVFTGGIDVKEIYLISGDKKHRTAFRWNWSVDTHKPSAAPCGSTTFGSGCIGTIEFLKLEGKDRGIDHSKSGSGYADGIIDTWMIDPNFTGGSEIIAGTGTTNYRQSIFPNSISVTDFKVFMYPNTDIKLAWKDAAKTEINPYVRIQISLLPSWKKRVAMKGKPPEVSFSTTIHLTDYFNK